MVSVNKGKIENVYSVNINGVQKERMEVQGPNIYSNNGIIENSYYFYDETFEKSYDTNTSKLALYDTNFQNQVLNGDGKFEIEETVKNGYFPTLKMPDVMPAQEYIKLPEIKNEDLPDVISSSIIEKNNNEAIIEMNVHNPSGETITEIGIQYLETEIESQEYAEGKSKVRVKVKNPTKYISEYNVIKLVTKGAYGIPYERVYKEKERVLKLDLYRKIENIEDWKEINKLPTENYKLVKDIDFLNAGKEVLITNTYTGILDGGNHRIKNVRVEGGESGLIKSLSGTVKNLRIENYEQKINSGTYGGVISVANSKSEINNIHISNAKIEIGEGREAIVGVLNGKNSLGKVENCSVNHIEIKTEGEAKSVMLGGLIGGAYSTTISNNYGTDIKIEVKEALNSKGIGGLVGENGGTIQYCYVEGKIETEKEKAGGIAGNNTGSVKNNYSKVDIETTSIYVGGIVGENQKRGENGVIYNLYLGNLYSRGEIENRIVGNGILSERNYGYKEQRINGEKKEDPVVRLLSREEILKESSYEDLLYMEKNFNYEELEKGILPKLYYEEKKELLPNQKDIGIEEEEIKIEEIYSEKADVNTGNVKVTIKNEAEYQIKDVKIEDMTVEIINNVNQEGKTYLDLKVRAERYYDSYKISEIIYQTKEGEERKEEVAGKVKLQFYKEITKYEDWQGIDKNSGENYRLLTDIDFSGKVNPNYNVSIGRLEAPEEGYAIKNLTIKAQGSEGLIKELKTSMKNIRFENITIENSGTGNYEGVIINNTAEIENVLFKDITINAPKMNYVSCIANSVSNYIQDISLERVKCYGNSYVAGFISYITESDCSNVIGNEIEIEGKGDNIGGLFGRIECPDYNITQSVKTLKIEDSKITGNGNYVGGAIGYGRINNGTSNRNIVSGMGFVGGLSGYGHVKNVDAKVSDSKIYGNKNNIGSVVGYANSLENVFVYNCDVIAEDNNARDIGGVLGGSAQIIRRIVVIDVRVISNGDNVGGISGRTDSGNKSVICESYLKDCYVEGNNKIGGIVGTIQSGTIYNNYSNTQILAKGNDTGGITGYAQNLTTTSVSDNRIQIYINNIAGSKITGQANIGGIIGKVDKELFSEEQFVNNYVEAYLEGKNIDTISLGIGSNKEYNANLKNAHIYQYSTINGSNINAENDTWNEAQYLKENDLKSQGTYTQKLFWSTSTWDFSVLQDSKYPILKNIEGQEGIPLPVDSEHIVTEEDGKISTLEERENTNNLEKKNETLQEIFEYEGKKIETYETYTKITLEDRTTVIRPERIYVKEGKLYVLDGSLDMVVNNFIVDSYNGKEYETILGTDGKLYDLKESLHYPENFKNKEIKEIGNNLDTEAKEMTVTYQDGSYVRFNYQTGEVLEEKKVEQKVSLFSYIAEAFEKENVMLEPSKESYEESKDLMGKLEKLPIEEAKERKASEEANSNTANQNEIVENQTMNGQTEQENNLMSNGITSKEKTYISKYNSKTGEYEVYDEEEILESKESEVISEEEKIEKENLNEYYSEEKRTEENAGIVWIMLSIAGAVIILVILGKKMTAKKKKDPNTRTRK